MEESKQANADYGYEYYSEEGETNGQFDKTEEELFDVEAEKQDRTGAASVANPQRHPKISLDLSNIEPNRKIGQSTTTSKFRKNDSDAPKPKKVPIIK